LAGRDRARGAGRHGRACPPVHRAHRPTRDPRTPAPPGVASPRGRGRPGALLAVLVVHRAAARGRRPRPDPPGALRPAMALLRAGRRGPARAVAALAAEPARPAGPALRLGAGRRGLRWTDRTVRAGALLAGGTARGAGGPRRGAHRAAAPAGGPGLAAGHRPGLPGR